MPGEDGKPREDLFVADRLHLNRKGYELWTSIVAPRVREAMKDGDAAPATSP
jgi:lysophospholipase L1-like esterase